MLCYATSNQNKYNRSIFFIVSFWKSLIYEWRYYRQTIFNQLNILVLYVDIIGLCHSVAILWEIYVMRHKYHQVAVLSFQANANYGTWSIDFATDYLWVCLWYHVILQSSILINGVFRGLYYIFIWLLLIWVLLVINKICGFEYQISLFSYYEICTFGVPCFSGVRRIYFSRGRKLV